MLHDYMEVTQAGFATLAAWASPLQPLPGPWKANLPL